MWYLCSRTKLDYDQLIHKYCIKCQIRFILHLFTSKCTCMEIVWAIQNIQTNYLRFNIRWINAKSLIKNIIHRNFILSYRGFIPSIYLNMCSFLSNLAQIFQQFMINGKCSWNLISGAKLSNLMVFRPRYGVYNFLKINNHNIRGQ